MKQLETLNQKHSFQLKAELFFKVCFCRLFYCKCHNVLLQLINRRLLKKSFSNFSANFRHTRDLQRRESDILGDLSGQILVRHIIVDK